MASQHAQLTRCGPPGSLRQGMIAPHPGPAIMAMRQGPTMAPALAGAGMAGACVTSPATTTSGGMGVLDQLKKQADKMLQEQESTRCKLDHYHKRLQQATDDCRQAQAQLNEERSRAADLSATLEEERKQFERVEDTMQLVTMQQNGLLQELSLAKAALGKVDGRRVMMEKLLLHMTTDCMVYQQRYEELLNARDGLMEELRLERETRSALEGQVNDLKGLADSKAAELEGLARAQESAAIQSAAAQQRLQERIDHVESLLAEMNTQVNQQTTRADASEAARHREAQDASRREASLQQERDKVAQECSQLAEALEVAQAKAQEAVAAAKGEGVVGNFHCLVAETHSLQPYVFNFCCCWHGSTELFFLPSSFLKKTHTVAAAEVDEELQRTREAAASDLAVKESELQETQALIVDLQSKLSAAEGAIDAERLSKEGLQTAISELRDLLDQMNASKEGLEQQLVELHVEVESVKTKATSDKQADIEQLESVRTELEAAEARFKAAIEEQVTAVQQAVHQANSKAEQELRQYQHQNAKAFSDCDERIKGHERNEMQLKTTIKTVAEERDQLQAAANKANQAASEASITMQELTRKLASCEASLFEAQAAADRAAQNASATADTINAKHKLQMATAKQAADDERNAALVQLRAEWSSSSEVLQAQLEDARKNAAAAAASAQAKQRKLERDVEELQKCMEEMTKDLSKATGAEGQAALRLQDKEAQLAGASVECERLRVELEAMRTAADMAAAVLGCVQAEAKKSKVELHAKDLELLQARKHLQIAEARADKAETMAEEAYKAAQEATAALDAAAVVTVPLEGNEQLLQAINGTTPAQENTVVAPVPCNGAAKNRPEENGGQSQALCPQNRLTGSQAAAVAQVTASKPAALNGQAGGQVSKAANQDSKSLGTAARGPTSGEEGIHLDKHLATKTPFSRDHEARASPQVAPSTDIATQPHGALKRKAPEPDPGSCSGDGSRHMLGSSKQHAAVVKHSDVVEGHGGRLPCGRGDGNDSDGPSESSARSDSEGCSSFGRTAELLAVRKEAMEAKRRRQRAQVGAMPPPCARQQGGQQQRRANRPAANAGAGGVRGGGRLLSMALSRDTSSIQMPSQGPASSKSQQDTNQRPIKKAAGGRAARAAVSTGGHKAGGRSEGGMSVSTATASTVVTCERAALSKDQAAQKGRQQGGGRTAGPGRVRGNKPTQNAAHNIFGSQFM